MGDLIKNLPVDPIPKDDSGEMQKLDGVFIDDKKNHLRGEAKQIAMGAVAFLLAYITKPAIQRVFPKLENITSFIVIVQALIAGVVYYLLRKWT